MTRMEKMESRYYFFYSGNRVEVKTGHGRKPQTKKKKKKRKYSVKNKITRMLKEVGR